MNLFLKFLEKALTSLLVSFLLFFASFSFMTGKFPPRKEEMVKAVTLLQQMFVSTKEYNAQAARTKGKAPSLEQLVELQRLGLKRSEVSLELQKIFSRLPGGSANEELALKLRKVSENLVQAENGLTDINEELRALTEAK